MTPNELQANLAEGLERSNILIRRLDGTIEYWTKGCERLFGWSAAEAIGQKAHELLQSKFPAPLDEIHRMMGTSGSWQGDLMQRHKDGRWLLISTDWALLPVSERGGAPTFDFDPQRHYHPPQN